MRKIRKSCDNCLYSKKNSGYEKRYGFSFCNQYRKHLGLGDSSCHNLALWVLDNLTEYDKGDDDE